jgi:lipopolysaccharide export system permease protein
VSQLDRYLAREILLPFGVGLVFLTQLLLATQLLGQGGVLFGSGVSLLDIAVVALALVPHLLGYVLPVSFLLGAVVGVARLAQDRELVALGAAGVSGVRLVKVPLTIGVATAAAALWIGWQLEPAGLRLAIERMNRVVQKNVAHDVRAGIFYEEIPDLTLYAERVDERGWSHVLISDRSDPAAPLLALASGGRLEPAGPAETMRLVLDLGELHREETSAGEYFIGDFRHATVTVGLGSALGERNRLSGSPFELTLDEVAATARTRGKVDPGEGRHWRTFFHRRIAGPLGILAFALLAVPIAASRRGGRAFGYVATLFSVLAYYTVLRFGEGLSQRGALPVWLGPNLANLLFAAVGLLLLFEMERRGPGAVR